MPSNTPHPLTLLISAVPDIDPLTPGEVAALLGVDVSSVLRWGRAGQIGSFRTPGGRVRYPRAELVRLLTQGYQPAVDGARPPRPGRRDGAALSPAGGAGPR